MNVNIHKLNASEIPDSLKSIGTPPKQLHWAGLPPEEWIGLPKLAIVGSRKMSAYGAWATQKFAGETAKQGIVIISGLALGVDAAAHKAALEAGGLTVAVLPTSLDNIYPASHLNLAKRIMEQGTLLSEYVSGEPVYKGNFTNRNRLISGLADALLITEAAINSGSLHTARFALEQGKTVMVVPGNINHPGSEGCNNLIKSGALPVTEPGDIFSAMGLIASSKKTKPFRGTETEEKIYRLISRGIADQEDIALKAGLSASEVNSILTILEINGYISPAGAGNWIISG